MTQHIASTTRRHTGTPHQGVARVAYLTTGRDLAGDPTDATPISAAMLFAGPGDVRALSRQLDWSTTPLGPVAAWPAGLRAIAGLVMAAPVAMIVMWGPDRVQIYNDAYRAVMGAKHPTGLGQPTHLCWPETRDFTEPLYAGVIERGESFTFDNQRLVLERNGVPEETFFTLSFSGVPSDRGEMAGVLITVFETTDRTQAQRTESERARLAMVLDGERIALFEEVFRTAPSFLRVMRGPRFVIELANEAYYVLVGRRDLIGRPAFDAMPEAAQGGHEERLRQVMATRQPFIGREMPVTLARTPGAPPEERIIDVVYLPLVDERGECTGVLGHGTDVTDSVRARRAIETALRTSETRYRTLFESIDQGFCVIEVLFDETDHAVDYRFLETNPAFVKQTGLVDGVGRRVREFAPNHEEYWFEAYGRVALTGEPIRFEAPADTLGQWFDVYAFRIGKPQDRQIALLFADIGDRKRADAERERLLAVAESANRAKGEFLAVMSHELRTPLNAIGGYAQLMEMGLRGPVTEAQRADLGRIQQSERHLLGLINQVLNYTRIEAGGLRYEMQEIAARAALDGAEALILPQMQSRGLRYVVDAGPDGVVMRVDAEKLQQVLLNLLTNAVKFTEPGGEVRVSWVAHDGTVAIAVADTGIGIAADRLEHIFEPFVQIDQRLTRPHEGVGLGLAISRDLARGMGGDLTAESTPRVGSTFTVTVPRVA